MKKLLEQRAAIVAKMRAITAAPAGQNGDLSEAQTRAFDDHKTELDRLEASIERQRVVDEAERRMEGKPIHSSGDDTLDTELRKFSLVRAMASQVPDLAGRVDIGRERELSQELAKRSGLQFQGMAVPLTVFEKRVITATGAGDLVGTSLQSGQFIDTLRNALVIKRLGARVLSGLVGNVDIPKRLTSSTAHWFADNAAITPSDATFDKIGLTPKHVGAITEFSRNMILQTSPDIEALVRDDFAQILAEAVDGAAILGGGSNEPSGLLDQGDLNTDVSMASPSWAKVLEIIEALDVANVDGAAWLTDPSVVRKLRSTVRVTSTDSRFIMDGPNDLAGYPLATTNQRALYDSSASPGDSHKLIFGKWNDILLGYWSVFDLLVNPYESTAYSKGNVSVRGIITCDVQIRRIESFAASVDVAV